MTHRKKPGVAFWVTVTLFAVLVGYPLSFGPACWITSRLDEPHPIFNAVYSPLCSGACAVSESTWDALTRFGGMGMPRQSMLVLQSDSPSTTWTSAGIFGPAN